MLVEAANNNAGGVNGRAHHREIRARTHLRIKKLGREILRSSDKQRLIRVERDACNSLLVEAVKAGEQGTGLAKRQPQQNAGMRVSRGGSSQRGRRNVRARLMLYVCRANRFRRGIKSSPDVG